ncbi:MAG: hypothetical protein IJD70_10315 [Clostridia bacterium]|nr:hypothetical protein [Clostridia bacterium]
MTIAYGVIFALSLLLPVGYYLVVRKTQNEPWLFVLYLSVCVVNLGYLLLSLSKTVEFALAANKIAYFGQVFVPLCMFMIISGLCGFTYKKWVKYVLIAAAMLMFGLVLTTGRLDWYYKSVELTYADGAAKLIKEYGFLHPVNLIYVLGYFVAMLVVISISLKKNNGKSQKIAGLMLAVVFGNIGMWLVEKLVTWNFEFLSASYLMSEFVFFFVYWMLQDYVHKNEVPPPVIVEEKAPIIIVDNMTRAEKIKTILDSLPEDTVLSTRQMDILERILDYKSRKEIAAELHLSENTVKTHTGMLYKALGVSGRDEIYAMFQK